MSTLEIFERHISPFDILFRNHFKSDSTFQPVGEFKQPHPLNIFFDDAGLHFEVACTGLDKSDVDITIEGDILKISYDKGEEKTSDSSRRFYHSGIKKSSFNFGWKVARRFELAKANAEMNNGLLIIAVPYANESKPKSLKIK